MEYRFLCFVSTCNNDFEASSTSLMSLWANIKFFPEPTGELYGWLLATLVVHVITWYRCGQSQFYSCDHMGGGGGGGEKMSQWTKAPVALIRPCLPFGSCDHVIQVWTCGRMEKSPNVQKPPRTKAPRTKIKVDKSPSPDNILILQHSRCTIPSRFMWWHDTGVDSPHLLGGAEKSQYTNTHESAW